MFVEAGLELFVTVYTFSCVFSLGCRLTYFVMDKKEICFQKNIYLTFLCSICNCHAVVFVAMLLSVCQSMTG